jgi:hypothetical protein
MTDDEIIAHMNKMCQGCCNNPAPAGYNPGCNGGCESTIGWEAMLEDNQRVRLVGQLGNVLKQVAEKKSRGQLNSREFRDVEGLLCDVASWCQGHLDGEGWDEVKAIFDRYRLVPRPQYIVENWGTGVPRYDRDPDYSVQLPIPAGIPLRQCATCTLAECSNYLCLKSVYCQFYTGGPTREPEGLTGYDRGEAALDQHIDTTKTTGVHEQKFKAGL